MTCGHDDYKKYRLMCKECHAAYMEWRGRTVQKIGTPVEQPTSIEIRSTGVVARVVPETPMDLSCRFRLGVIEALPCVSCPKESKNTVQVKGCSLHGRCTDDPKKVAVGVKQCRFCNDILPPIPPLREGGPLTWAVGVTTVPSRKDTTLPPTLKSLAKAGWEAPRLFVDGGGESDWRGVTNVTVRPKTHALGNWWLAMQELYVRNPLADRYMMVQDDVVFCKGVRGYLDVVEWPGRGYLNLYTFRHNDLIGKGRAKGFFRASQRWMGLGALALVFDKESVVEILTARHMIEKFRPKEHPEWAVKKIDGGVAEAMKAAGMSEWCHMPSLVQHIGNVSTLNHNNPQAISFEGEDYDIRELLQ